MPNKTKRQKALVGLVDAEKAYSIDEALKLLLGLPPVKFTEAVDVAVRLGVDTRKSDQVVKGATVLPNGTGRTVQVAVFAQGEQANAATAAGADRVGFDDLADELKSGNCPFDVIIATPDAMPLVGKLGPVLGPKGLMPNPKLGTVSPDAAEAVRKAKSGQVRYKTDRAGIVHSSIGKVNFEPAKLIENLLALLADLKRLKPASSKGVYIQKVSLSTTMGLGITVDLSTLS